MTRRGSWRKNRDIANAQIRESLAVVAEVKAAEEAERQERIAVAHKAEAERVRFTAEQLKDGRFVKDEFGWHFVVRVNAKSVTVETPYSWTDRIAVDKIHDLRNHQVSVTHRSHAAD